MSPGLREIMNKAIGEPPLDVPRLRVCACGWAMGVRPSGTARQRRLTRTRRLQALLKALRAAGAI